MGENFVEAIKQDKERITGDNSTERIESEVELAKERNKKFSIEGDKDE